MWERIIRIMRLLPGISLLLTANGLLWVAQRTVKAGELLLEWGGEGDRTLIDDPLTDADVERGVFVPELRLVHGVQS